MRRHLPLNRVDEVLYPKSLLREETMPDRGISLWIASSAPTSRATLAASSLAQDRHRRPRYAPLELGDQFRAVAVGEQQVDDAQIEAPAVVDRFPPLGQRAGARQCLGWRSASPPSPWA